MFDFLRTLAQGQNARIYKRCWTTKLLSARGPDFFVSTFPEIGEYKISVPWLLNKVIKKLLFLPSKMGVDLYMGSTYTRVNTVVITQDKKQ